MPAKIHLIVPSAPPRICGVGDHGFLLGSALAAHACVSVHCGQHSPAPRLAPLDHLVDFDYRDSKSLLALARTGDFQAGDWLFFQYTNFAYGRRGFNPWLAPALRQFRARGLKVATMFHETYTDQPGLRGLAMRTWQRLFFHQVGKASDLALFSVEPWTLRYRSWFPKAQVETLAVGSNIPKVPLDRERERAALGIAPSIPTLGVFGGLHPSRLFGWIVSASQQLSAAGIEHRILRIGPDGEKISERLSGAPLVDLGILDPEPASRALSCCDLFLSPISDGASSRRGSLLAGLGHGLPCITSLGASSDAVFRNAAGTAFEAATGQDDFSRLCRVLILDPARRSRLALQAQDFHDKTFGWDAIARRLLSLLATR